MKILITGGAGFIGSTLVKYIINETPHKVVNVDKLTYSANLDALNSVKLNKKYSFEQVDICSSDELRRVFIKHQPDSIMHLAAESHVDRSISSPINFIQTNIIGTFQLLEAARVFWSSLIGEKRENFRFHHISTDEVYGDLGDTNDFFSENSHYNPSSPYSASKASSDHLVKSWHRTYGFPALISHCSNNYGPYQHVEKLIPLIITNALLGRSIPIYGDGLQIRDWLYVADHVKALYKILMKGRIGETYDIGGCNEKTNLEVTHRICSILDELIPNKTKNHSHLITHVEDRQGHDRRYAINAAKIQSELDWYPEETFDSGVRKTIEWYLARYLKSADKKSILT